MVRLVMDGGYCSDNRMLLELRALGQFVSISVTVCAALMLLLHLSVPCT